MKQIGGLALLLAVAGAVADAQAGYYEEEVETVLCESYDRRQVWCEADTSYGVEIYEQTSRTPCIEGQNWGYGRRGIWVSGGCRAEFALGAPEVEGQTIICESLNRRRTYCPVRIYNGAELIEQISNADCDEGITWGYDRGGVWVSGGCRGEFLVE